MTITSSILLTSGGGGTSGTITGPRNKIEVYTGTLPSTCEYTSGGGDWSTWGSTTFTWTKPSAMKADVPLIVHVWGPGGNSGSNNTGFGGGGGGYAYKKIPVASLNTTETITIGVPHWSTKNSRGSDSSFGSHCSATGGNDGANTSNPSGNPNATGENANPQTSVDSGYGQGGIGVGGDINRRGGQGGYSHSVNPSSGSGGGGGSAPRPISGIYEGTDGRDGYRGGSGHSSYYGASGASICYPGSNSPNTWHSTGGAGTAGYGIGSRWNQDYRTKGGGGGAGLFGAGGRGYSLVGWTNDDNLRPGGQAAKSGHGGAIWDPNGITLGGGGGGGGGATRASSGQACSAAGNGGPGAGGGSYNVYDSSASTRGGHAGGGGVLGGSGGGGQYVGTCMPGCAGGGGASGWDAEPYGSRGQSIGGFGLIVLQYAVE